MKTYPLFFTILLLFLLSCGRAPFVFKPNLTEKKLKADTVTVELKGKFNHNISLSGLQYKFNYELNWLAIDPEHSRLMMVCKSMEGAKDNSQLCAFDLNKNQTVWELYMNRTPGPTYISNYLILDEDRKIIAFNSEDGKIKWEKPGYFHILDPLNNLAYVKGKSSLTLFNILDGQNIWTSRKVSLDWWANENQIIHDALWLHSGNGLHLFSLNDGTGWDVDVPTAATGGVGREIAKLIGEILLRLMNPYYIGSSSFETDKYESLTSNALVMDNKIYYAGNRIIVCVDLDSGEKLWQTKLPKIGAHSSIYPEGENVLLLAEGWCYKNYEFHDYSIPYIALFDQSTGKQILYKPFGSNKHVQSKHITDSEYTILSGGKIYNIDKANLQSDVKRLELKNKQKEQYGVFEQILHHPEKIYLPIDSTADSYQSLEKFSTDKTKMWIQTTKSILQYDLNLEIEKSFPISEAFVEIRVIDNLCFLIDFVNKRTIKVIDQTENGFALGFFRAMANIKYFDEAIYMWEKNVLYQIPLEPLISYQNSNLVEFSDLSR